MDSEKAIIVNGHKHILYEKELFSEAELLKKSNSFYNLLKSRRSIREFSDINVPKEVVKNIIKTAGVILNYQPMCPI